MAGGRFSLGVSWVPKYCSTSLIESSKRAPVLWVALTPLATNWQTSKRFIPCASARWILSERMTSLRSTGDCCVRCGTRQERWDGNSRAGFSNSKVGLMTQLCLHCTPETALTPLFTRPRRFRRRENPVILWVTSTRYTGNPEEIRAKEVTSGRHRQD